MPKRTSIPILEFLTLVVVVAGCVIAVVPDADQFAIGLIANRSENNASTSNMVVEAPVERFEMSTDFDSDQVENDLAMATEAADIEFDSDMDQESAADEQDWEFSTAANEEFNVDVDGESPEEQPSKTSLNAILVSQSSVTESENVAPLNDMSQEFEDAGFFDDDESNETFENSDEQALSDFLENAEREFGIDNSNQDKTSDSVTSVEEVPFFIQPISEDTDAESVMEDFATVIKAKETRSEENQLRLSGPVDVDDRTAMLNQQVEESIPEERPDRVASLPAFTENNPNDQHQQPKAGSGSTSRNPSQLGSSVWASNPTFAPVGQNRATDNGSSKIGASGSQTRFEPRNSQRSWQRVENQFIDNGADIPGVMKKSSPAAPAPIRNQHIDLDWSMQELPANKRRSAVYRELGAAENGVPSLSVPSAK